MTLGADVGAHAAQFVHVQEPALEDVLGGDAGAFGGGEHRHQDRLEVGRHPRVGQRDEVDRPRRRRSAGCGARPRVIDRRRPHRRAWAGTGRDDRRGHRASVRSPPVATAAAAHVPASIRSGIVMCSVPVQRVHAVDLDRAASGAVDPRAHRHEELGDVGDLGLARGVVDHGRAARPHGGHHEVLGRADAGVVERDRGAPEPVGLGDQEPVLGPDLGAHAPETRDVQVDRARPDLVATGHRDPRAGPARASSEPSTAVEARMRRTSSYGASTDVSVRGVDRDGVAVPGDPGAQMLEHLAHREAVLDPGHVVQHGPAGREQRGGHQLEGGVLGAGDDRSNRPGAPLQSPGVVP